MLPSRKASAMLGVHASTLRRWANEGKINHVKTPAGQRLYDVESFLAGTKKRRTILYARVSSRNQRDDLANQVATLKQRYPEYEVIEDIGSGLNFKRKGFTALLDAILSGSVAEVVVAHKDRLCRFGFELLEYLASKNGCRIVVLDDSRLSPSGELVADLLSIIHLFSYRLYGLHRYHRQIKEDKNLSQEGKHTKDEAIPGIEPVLVQPGD